MVTISFVKALRPSLRTEQFNIKGFPKTCRENSNAIKIGKLTSTLFEGQYTYCSVLLRMRNVSVKDVRNVTTLILFISVFNLLDEQYLFHNKFYFMPLHVSSTCAHHQEVKIALHSLWYHHTYRCDDTRYCETNSVHQIG